MKLLVLAGGFGMRLRTVVADLPKPLAPVGDVPFLRLQLEHWVGQGLNSFVFLLHHKANLVLDFIQAEQFGLLQGCELQFVVEQMPMGTGGAIAHAITQLDLVDEFLVANADTWLGCGVKELSGAHAPAMAVVHVDNTERYGSVEIDNATRVSSFMEKNASVGAGWINAGMYRLSPAQFASVPGEVFSLEAECLPGLAAAGVLKAVRLDTDFIDIGVPDDYFRMCRWVSDNRGMKL